MELSFVMRSIRRYWWITAVFVLGGVVAAAQQGGEGQYSSVALVLVAPSPGQGFGSQPPDRHVQTQLALMDSEVVAAGVAQRIDGLSTAAVTALVDAEQVSDTDIIRVTASGTSPAEAQAIGTAFVASYLEAIRGQLTQDRSAELLSLDEAISTVRAELEEVDVQIEEELAAFVRDAVTADDQGQVNVPAIEQIAPALATEREVLLSRYFDLVRLRDQTELGSSQLGSRAQVLQAPSAGALTTAPPPMLLFFAGSVAGLLLGSATAVVAARLSPRVLDLVEAEEILGRDIVADLQHVKGIGDYASLLAGPIPEAVQPDVLTLCLRTEATPLRTPTLTIAVFGASAGAGATTVVACMARQFADEGRSVLVIDANPRDPALTEAVSEGPSGVRALVEGDPPSGTDTGKRSKSDEEAPRFGQPAPGLTVAGLGSATERFVLRRHDVPTLVGAATQRADVVIIDAGAVMESASAARFAEHADVIVLVLAVRYQRIAGLRAVSRQLGTAAETVVPVSSRPSRPRPDRPDRAFEVAE